jgi:hypothetical protein
VSELLHSTLGKDEDPSRPTATWPRDHGRRDFLETDLPVSAEMARNQAGTGYNDREDDATATILPLPLEVPLATTFRPDERVRAGRQIVRDACPTGDSALDDALATVGRKEGKHPQNVVAALGKRTWVRLYERLAEAGLLRSEQGRILGIFPTHRWPAEQTGHEAAVRAGLATALRHGGATDARTGALVSLLLALKAVHKAVTPEYVGHSKGELNASGKRIPLRLRSRS